LSGSQSLHRKEKGTMKAKGISEKERGAFQGELEKFKADLEQMRGATFEELREAFVDFAGGLLEFQFMTLEHFINGGDQVKEWFVDYGKQVRTANDKDFKVIAKKLHEFEHRVSACEAAAVMALLYSVSTYVREAEREGKITNYSEMLKSVTPEVRRFIASTLHVDEKKLPGMMHLGKKLAA